MNKAVTCLLHTPMAEQHAPGVVHGELKDDKLDNNDVFRLNTAGPHILVALYVDENEDDQDDDQNDKTEEDEEEKENEEVLGNEKRREMRLTMMMDLDMTPTTMIQNMITMARENSSPSCQWRLKKPTAILRSVTTMWRHIYLAGRCTGDFKRD